LGFLPWDWCGWPRFGGSSLNRWKFGPNRYLFISFLCLSVTKIFVSNYIPIVHTISLGKKWQITHGGKWNFLQPIRWGSVHPRFFLWPQANGLACVDVGCTHPIDGLFWCLPIYLLSFFSKYECWVTDLIMPLYHFIFLGCHLPFCIMSFHIIMKCTKISYD
jgi:hypothetical protein